MATSNSASDVQHDQTVVASTPDNLPEQYSKRQKWFIVCMISFAGIIRCVVLSEKYLSMNQWPLASPFTGNIYFPAIPIIAEDFHKSIELINLTVTMYLIFQGICESSVTHAEGCLIVLSKLP
jgi:hypothetical protein